MLEGAAEVLERRRTTSTGDRGMIVGIVSWILVVAMAFTLLTRLAMKFAVVKKGRKFGLDDLFVVLAALFSIGQTAAVSMEAMHALGQHRDELTERQRQIFMKAEYAGCLLYIANMGCARISVCLLVKKILPGNCAKRIALTFAIFSALWTISGVLVTAFPCSLPSPWIFTGRKCIDLIKFGNYVGITNIVVEVILMVIPLFVWNLRLSASRSISVSCVFLSRLGVIAAVSAQLAVFNRHVRSPDFTYEYWSSTLCIQIAQNLSIITACLPCLHPFVLSILAGNTQPETIRFDNDKCTIKCYSYRKPSKFDCTSSQSSTKPMKEDDIDYCRPLATYGLDRSSAHLNSQHFNRFHNNVATLATNPNPPENVFMRNVDIPSMRPLTSSSPTQNPDIPKSLYQVGVLPTADWETDSSDRGSELSSHTRRPNSEYIFSRDKVISVPEGAMYEPDLWKRYPPPPMSGEK